MHSEQRNRGRGRPARDEKMVPVVPLLEAAFVRDLHRYHGTYRPGRRTPLFAVPPDSGVGLATTGDQ